MYSAVATKKFNPRVLVNYDELVKGCRMYHICDFNKYFLLSLSRLTIFAFLVVCVMTILHGCDNGGASIGTACSGNQSQINSISLQQADLDYRENLREISKNTGKEFDLQKGLQGFNLGTFIKSDGDIIVGSLEGNNSFSTDTSSSFTDFFESNYIDKSTSTSNSTAALIFLPVQMLGAAASENASIKTFRYIKYNFKLTDIELTTYKDPDEILKKAAQKFPAADQFIYGVYEAKIEISYELFDECSAKIDTSKAGFSSFFIAGYSDYEKVTTTQSNEIKFQSKKPVVIAYLKRKIFSDSFAPANVTLTEKNNGISLNWDAVSSAEKYAIYWSYQPKIIISDASTYQDKSSTESVSFFLSNTIPSQQYCFKVTSIDDSRRESDASLEHCITLSKDTTPPSNVIIKFKDILDGKEDNITNIRQISLDLYAEDNVGVDAYLITENNELIPSTSYEKWTEIKPVLKVFNKEVKYLLTPFDEIGLNTKKLYVWFRDKNKNISDPFILSVRYDYSECNYKNLVWESPFIEGEGKITFNQLLKKNDSFFLYGSVGTAGNVLYKKTIDGRWIQSENQIQDVDNIVYGNNIFIGACGEIHNRHLCKSENGINWSTINIDSNRLLEVKNVEKTNEYNPDSIEDIAINNQGVFAAIKLSGDILISRDGAIWEQERTPEYNYKSGYLPKSIVSVENRFYALRGGTTDLLFSDIKGQNWTSQSVNKGRVNHYNLIGGINSDGQKYFAELTGWGSEKTGWGVGSDLFKYSLGFTLMNLMESSDISVYDEKGDKIELKKSKQSQLFWDNHDLILYSDFKIYKSQDGITFNHQYTFKKTDSVPPVIFKRIDNHVYIMPGDKKSSVWRAICK